jgi:putative hemolysin
VLLLLFGEIGPKQLGLTHAERFARFSAPLVLWLVWFLTPLRLMLESTTRRFRHIFKPRCRSLSIEEFETVLDISGEEGILNGDELAMIKAVMNLEDLKASDVMTPRVDLIGVDLDDPEVDVAAKARVARRNYLLLYRGQWDEIAGILDVRRYLLDPERRREAATFPPSYVPESIPLNLLLARFQKERRRIAVVVDEYGGTAGVITRGDILEEISGEIYSEISKPRPLFQSAGPFRWLVDATISLEEINRKLHLQLEAEGVDRLAGWITARTGHMPQQGDVIEDNGCRITVLQMVKQRVTLAQIEKAG